MLLSCSYLGLLALSFTRKPLISLADPARFERATFAFGAIKPALRPYTTGFAPMRYVTVITKQIEILARLTYPLTRSDLRPAAYVVLTREWEFGRENSHG